MSTYIHAIVSSKLVTNVISCKSFKPIKESIFFCLLPVPSIVLYACRKHLFSRRPTRKFEAALFKASLKELFLKIGSPMDVPMQVRLAYLIQVIVKCFKGFIMKYG